jgi:predicted TIM-barrel fold metal-dependent hydrolase
MLFTCTPPGTRIDGRFPGPKQQRGKWFTVDIHCHVHLDRADEMVRPFWNPDRDATMKFANDRTREVQRQQMERTHGQLTSIEQRLTDMDEMGIDMQAISPAPVQMFYWTEPELGLASARPDCCEHLKEDPTTYLKRLHFDTMVFTHHQLEYLVRQYGPDHVLMGTDYPYDMGETNPIGFVENAPGLNDAERRQIFGGNAARLLGLEVPAGLR